eukprot:1136808-Pelagomonas_calceolata.AAC.1
MLGFGLFKPLSACVGSFFFVAHLLTVSGEDKSWDSPARPVPLPAGLVTSAEPLLPIKLDAPASATDHRPSKILPGTPEQMVRALTLLVLAESLPCATLFVHDTHAGVDLLGGAFSAIMAPVAGLPKEGPAVHVNLLFFACRHACPAFEWATCIIGGPSARLFG